MNVYLFDFDGTLVDSMPTYISAMLGILDAHGIAYDENLVQIITPLGTLGTAEYYRKMGLDLTVEEIVSEMKNAMLSAYFHDIPAKNNVICTLRQLKEAGASLNVLTASPHITLDACLKRLGIYDLFDNVWSCDDFGTTKADPGIYRMAAARLGVDVTEVLFLDDNLNADKTAKAAGMRVCGVYDASSENDTDEIRSTADFYISDFSELFGL